MALPSIILLVGDFCASQHSQHGLNCRILLPSRIEPSLLRYKPNDVAAVEILKVVWYAQMLTEFPGRDSRLV